MRSNPEEWRRYQREWVANRRAEWFKDKSCVRCGSTVNLQIDHVDPSKKVSNRIFSWSKMRREEELAKCQVLCGDCHKIKTQEDRGPLMHNSSGYRRGCRCSLCKEGHNQDNKRWARKVSTGSKTVYGTILDPSAIPG
jgi:hypothetical protein